MIISLWLVLSSVWLGGSLSFKLFHPFLTIFECIAAASPIGLTLSAWLGLFLKSFFFAQAEGLPAWLGFTACIIQTTIAVIITASIIKNWDRRVTKYWQYTFENIKWPLLFVILPLTIWFIHIHHTHSLLRDGEKYYVGGTVYGDMPFHLMIISSFLFGVNAHTAPLAGKPVMAAFYADSPLVYPYIPDFHTALLAGSGATLHFSLMLPGILLCFSFLMLLFFLNLRLTSSIVAASFAVPIIIMCGGTGAIQWLLFDRSWYGLRSVDHILVDSLTHNISICWFSLPAHILLPQRTTQFAYPISLLAFIIILRACKQIFGQSFKKSKSNNALSELPSTTIFEIDITWENLSNNYRLKLFAYAGLVTGLLPMLQAHSFVAVGVVMLVVAGLQLIKWFRQFRSDRIILITLVKQWGIYGVAAFAIGIPQSLVYLQRVSSSGFIRFQSIWSDFPPDQSPISLWLNAVGTFLPLFLFSLYYCRFSTIQRQFQFGFLGVFIIANFTIFQPWVLDNTKVFYVWVFGAGGAVSLTLRSLWGISSKISKDSKIEDEEECYGTPVRSSLNLVRREDSKPLTLKKILTRVGVVIIFFSLILSGTLCMFNESLSYDGMFDTADVESAYWIQQNTPVNARFAISTSPGSPHMRPEAALAGRQIMASYWGWISNHGMPNHVQRNADMISLLAGELDTREILLKYGIDYITVDKSHLHDYDMQEINRFSYLVASNRKYFIFKVVDRAALSKIEDCLPPDTIARTGVEVNEDTCLEHNCAWVPNGNGLPWCRSPAAKPPSHIDSSQLICDTESYQDHCSRKGCMWYGEECLYPVFESHYYQKSLRNINPLDIGMTHIQENRDCGWGGISEDECINLSCRWNPNNLGLPWCARIDSNVLLPSSTFATVYSLPSR